MRTPAPAEPTNKAAAPADVEAQSPAKPRDKKGGGPKKPPPARTKKMEEPPMAETTTHTNTPTHLDKSDTTGGPVDTVVDELRAIRAQLAQQADPRRRTAEIVAGAAIGGVVAGAFLAGTAALVSWLASPSKTEPSQPATTTAPA